MPPAPAHELTGNHGEQARRDFSERLGFLDDLLAANKLVRKVDVEGQTDLGVTGMSRWVAAIADTGRTVAKLMGADVGLRPNTD